MSYLITQADARRIPLADKSVQCCVTSPPYFGLRMYATAKWVGGDPECDHKDGQQTNRAINKNATNSASSFHAKNPCPKCEAIRVDSQIGLEETPEAYVAAMVEVFREVHRVLRDDGTCWLNIGDSYAGSWGNQGRKKGRGTQRAINGPMIQPVHDGRYPSDVSNTGKCPPGYKPKDLHGIPWMLAFALRKDGWYLRSEILWSKRSPMTESVKDRPSRSHEQVFLLTKRARYFYDWFAVLEKSKGYNQRRITSTNGRAVTPPGTARDAGIRQADGMEHRNLRTVWTLSSEPYKGAHFATMPSKLAVPCVKAGSSEHGCCVACGSPWERMVRKVRVASRPGVGSKVYLEPPVHPDSPVRSHAGDVCGNRDPRRHVTKYVHAGWRPTCRCGTDERMPCVVYDPFGGAGTVPMVASNLGRIGIATELSADYCRMALERLRRPHKRPVKSGRVEHHPLFDHDEPQADATPGVDPSASTSLAGGK